jgi:hypothetical protein
VKKQLIVTLATLVLDAFAANATAQATRQYYALIPFQNAYTGTTNIVTGGIQYNF